MKERAGPGDIVLITYGMLIYPLRLAETDGPLGGAALARALQVGLGAKPVLVADDEAVDMTKATCRGANLNVVDEQRLKETERTVSVIGFPIDKSGDVTEVDVCVAASVSNWGAYGVIACLSALLGNPEVLQDTKIEARMLRECIDAGGVDGISSLPKPWVDGMPEEVDYSIVTLLHEMAFARFDFPDFAKK